MKSHINFLLLFLFVFTSLNSEAQRRSDTRALRQRGSDSAWIYNPFMGATRFYIGNQRVTPLEFQNTLRNSDPKIEQLINEAVKRNRTALIVAGVGTVTGLVGLGILNYSDSYGNDNRTTTALVLMCTGVGLEITGGIINIGAATRFREGLRLFNQKAKNGAFHKNVQLGIGTTSNGAGLVLRF